VKEKKKPVFCGCRNEITEHEICRAPRRLKGRRCPELVHQNRTVISENIEHYQSMREEAIRRIKERGDYATDEAIFREMLDQGWAEPVAYICAVV